MRILQKSSELVLMNVVKHLFSYFFNCSCIHSLNYNGLTDESVPCLINLIKSAKSLRKLVIREDK